MYRLLDIIRKLIIPNAISNYRKNSLHALGINISFRFMTSKIKIQGRRLGKRSNIR
jgi:hypothetical protein